MQQQFNQYRQMKQFLVQNGMLPDDVDEPDAAVDRRAAAVDRKKPAKKGDQ